MTGMSGRRLAVALGSLLTIAVPVEAQSARGLLEACSYERPHERSSAVLEQMRRGEVPELSLSEMTSLLANTDAFLAAESGSQTPSEADDALHVGRYDLLQFSLEKLSSAIFRFARFEKDAVNALLMCDDVVKTSRVRQACLAATAEVWTQLTAPLPAIVKAAQDPDVETRVRAVTIARLLSPNLCDVLSTTPSDHDAKIGVGRAMQIVADQWLAKNQVSGRGLAPVVLLHDDGYYLIAIGIRSDNQRPVAHQAIYDLVVYLRSRDYNVIPYPEEVLLTPVVCGNVE